MVELELQTHSPFAVDQHLKTSGVFGTGRSANFTRDQLTSEPSIENHAKCLTILNYRSIM